MVLVFSITREALINLGFELNFFKKQQILAPVNGIIVDIENVNDVVFSKKIIGDGLAIRPFDGTVCSPCDGTIECILLEKHALFINCKDRTKILIHLGLDTVEMKGKGFNCFVSEKQNIKAGQLLTTMDLDLIKAHNKDDIVVVAMINDTLHTSNIIYKNSGVCLANKTVLFKYKK